MNEKVTVWFPAFQKTSHTLNKVAFTLFGKFEVRWYGILITLGIVFLIETLSDIIQVAYFKLTHGKRIFKMAPFHHHLEMGGWTGKKWKEKELFVLYTFVSALFAVISFIGVRGRF